MFLSFEQQIEKFNHDYLKLYLNVIGHGFQNKHDTQTMKNYLFEHISYMPFTYEFFYSQCSDFVICDLVKLHSNKMKIEEELIKVVCHPRNYHNFEALGFFE